MSEPIRKPTREGAVWLAREIIAEARQHFYSSSGEADKILEDLQILTAFLTEPNPAEGRETPLTYEEIHTTPQEFSKLKDHFELAAHVEQIMMILEKLTQEIGVKKFRERPDLTRRALEHLESVLLG